MYARKAMSLSLLFIMFLSLFAAFVGEIFQDRYEMHDTNDDDSYEEVIEVVYENRGTRADSNNMDLESRPLFGPASDIQVVGNYAYLAAGCSLLIFDITNTNNPILVGYYDSWSIISQIMGIHIEGNYAYLARMDGVLDIVNVQTPSSPYHETFVATEAEAMDVNVSGSYVYVAETDGMEIFERSTPTNLVPKGKFDTTGVVYNVYISDNFAYVPSEQEGFFIVNITDPDNPSEEGRDDTYAAIPYPRDVFVSGNYAYVADYYEGLVAFNITDKTNPQDVGREETSSNPWEIKIDDSYAFLADEGEGLAIIDVSTPESPSYHMNHDTPGEGDTISLFVENGYAFLADDLYGLKIVNVSGDPPSPMDEGSWEKTGNIAWSVHVEGDYAYIADGETGLVIMDMSNPNDPDYIGNYDTNGNSRAVDVVGDYAYVADDSGGLVVLDINDPTNPSFERSYPPLDSYTYDVDVVGSYAYLADYEDGLRIIDLNTDQQWWFNTEGHSYSVQVEGDFAYLGDGSGLRIINVSILSNPTEEGYYEIIQSGSASMGVHVAGSYAYVATFVMGLHIVDITNPSNPTLVGNYESEGISLTGVYALGTTVYHTNMIDGIIALDTSTPSNIQKTGYYNASGFCLDVKIAGSHAYLSAAIGGVYLLDITQTKDTTRPQIDSHSPTNDAVDILWNSDIIMNFTENMDHRSVENAFSITPSITGSFTWKGNNLTFIPNEDLSTATTYIVTIDSTAMDTAGNTLTSDYSWQFTTLAIPPVVVSVIPNDGATFVLIDASVIINFSHSMDKSSTQAAFSYTDGNLTFDSSYGLVTWSNDDRTMTFKPISYFENEKEYTFTIEHTAVDVNLTPLDGDNDGIGGEGTEDDYTWSFTTIPTPPTIVSTFPEAGDQDVKVNTNIIILFSKSMDRSSVQNAFKYTDDITEWGITDGIATWSDNDRNFTFTPSSAFDNNLQYWVTIAHTAMDEVNVFLDADGDSTPGEPGEDDYTWSFTTIPLPPQIITTSPLPGSTFVPINSSVTIEFSKTMDKSSTQVALTYTFDGITFGSTNGFVAWSNEDRTLTFTPLVIFQNEMVYIFKIEHTAADIEGVQFDGDEDSNGGEGIEDDYLWSFTTMPVPPKVVSPTPKKNAIDVAIDTIIEIKFTKPMDESSVEDAFTFTHGDTNLTWDAFDGNVSWDEDLEIMTFVPSFLLEHEKEYIITIEATAKDMQGITLDGNRNGLPEGVDIDYYISYFTTIPEPPKVESVEPSDGLKDVAIDADIVITFDKSMNKGSTEKAFSYIYEGSTDGFDKSDGSIEWTNNDKILTFDPDLDFEEGERYTVTIEDSARDADGIPFEGFEWSFTIKVNSPPVLEGGGVHPEEGDTSKMFKFSIVYTDVDDDKPESIEVVIGDISNRMLESDPQDEDYTDGKNYEFEISLDEGDHKYYFEASDEKHDVRFPAGQAKDTVKVSAVEEELIFGFLEEEYVGMPTLICGPIGIIFIIAIIISLILIMRKGRPSEETMAFEPFEEAAPPFTFMPTGDEEIMSFTAFEEAPSLEEAKPVLIQCPECDRHLRVRTVTRPFMFPCSCGAKLILK